MFVNHNARKIYLRLEWDSSEHGAKSGIRPANIQGCSENLRAGQMASMDIIVRRNSACFNGVTPLGMDIPKAVTQTIMTIKRIRDCKTVLDELPRFYTPAIYTNGIAIPRISMCTTASRARSGVFTRSVRHMKVLKRTICPPKC